MRAVYDLSATPFFLRGSGYRRGHAVPLDRQRLLADGRHRMRHRQAAARPGRRQPAVRRHADLPQPLGAHRQARCRSKGASKAGDLDPLKTPAELQTALYSLYSHYKQTFDEWDGRHRRAAGVHRRLQQHLRLEAGL